MDGTGRTGPWSEEDVVARTGEDGIDQSLPPFVRFRAWNLPSTEATRTTLSISRGSSSVAECPRGGSK
jgi:hypothetical protein